MSRTDFGVDAMLCDSAVVADGKLYVQGGGWNIMSGPTFPFRAPRIGLAVVVTVPYTATNRNHELDVALLDEDSNVPLPLGQPASSDPADVSAPGTIKGQFNLGRPPFIHPGDAQIMPFAINIDGQVFEMPGGFSFAVSVDGVELDRLSFRVVQSTQ